MSAIDPDRLYTEVEAAAVLGVKDRSLRTERTKGRLGYKPVAGKVMYRGRDLIDWLNDGVEPWHEEARDRDLSSSRPGSVITSGTPTVDAQCSAAQARLISKRLKSPSRTSSASEAAGKGRVIHIGSR